MWPLRPERTHRYGRPFFLYRFFARSELSRALYAFRREFFIVGLFSMVVNLLMLAPTLYMLQVYDRVLVSRSEVTLGVRLAHHAVLVRGDGICRMVALAFAGAHGVGLDAVLGTRVFNASLRPTSAIPVPRHGIAFQDLIELRRFDGQRHHCLFDLPWMPIYLAVLFFCTLPGLGWRWPSGGAKWRWHGLATAAPWHRRKSVESLARGEPVPARQAAQYRGGRIHGYVGRFAAALGPRATPRPWTSRAAHKRCRTASAPSANGCAIASKSFALAAGALLVVDGQLTAGAAIAANVLMTRALAPIDQVVGTWRRFPQCAPGV